MSCLLDIQVYLKEDINDFNKLVNYNTDELLKISKKTQDKIDDINHKHEALNVESFDTRESVLYDKNNNKAYIIDFSIANLKDGKKIAYAKKMAQANDDILNKIKTSIRSENSPIASSNNNVPQNDQKVNGTSTNSNMSKKTKYILYEYKNEENNYIIKEDSNEYYQKDFILNNRIVNYC